MVKAFFLFFFLAFFYGFPAEAASRLSLVFEAPVSEVYIGQEAFFQIKLMDRIGVRNVGVEPAEWPNADVFVLDRKDGNAVLENGMTYAVSVFHFSLIPKSAGKMDFPPLCLVMAAPTLISIRDLPEGVTGTPDGNIKICSPPFSMDVKSLPSYSKPLFAASEVKLFDGVAPKVPSVPSGSPVKRSVLLAVKGTLPVFLPDFQMEKIQNGRIYNGKMERTVPSLKGGISAALRQTFVIIPEQAGKLVLPEIKVPWLNTKTGRIETATIPAYSLTVLPSSEAKRERDDLSGEKVAPEQKKRLRTFFSSFIAFSVCVLIVAFSAGWNKKRIKQKKLIKAVQDACLENDFERASAAILKWAANAFPQEKFMNLADVRRLFSDKSADFVKKLEELEFYLYGTGRFAKHIPSAKDILGRELCHAFLQATQLKIEKRRMKKKHLPDLYPD